MSVRTHKLALAALGAALGLTLMGCAQAAIAQTNAWSADNGPSLFQTLGIAVPGGPARSQNLPRVYTDFTVITPKIKTATKTQIGTYAAIISPPSPPNPAATTASLPQTMTPQQAAGSISVSAPSPKFAPLNAEDSVETVPTYQQVAQVLPVQVPIVDEPEDDMIIVGNRVGSWRGILSGYVSEGSDGLARFDYAALSASPSSMAALDSYIQMQAQKTPSAMPRNEAMAYWANLYNALTVQVVAQNYPVGSIREIKSGVRKGPWKRKLVTVEGRTLSLDNIEHDIMRPTFKTPLVHYMVNCASIGCPNLKKTPWSADTLDVDLDAAARAYINSPRGVKISNGKVQASSIYKWFKKDFGGNNKGVLAHLIKYADADLAAQLQGRKKVDKYAYDWGVNAP